ncbi:methyl-accepting chemotaxis protein [Sphingomonas sp. Leaf25]|uniref:methyl-accepting chemotaxis protein n=1 Tax=Sphingomonas sp. Leaf25 TaxID=1735692 RepID=UPI000701D6A8|nr:methyl-accepting chemotaxis protein [Sphingomonas sp. Leaf25]KQM98199.1 chemotaxis protein [Sphingomonas sp. Leaf25]
MSVSTRIAAGFAAITAILLALGLYALAQIGDVRTTVDQIVGRDLASIQALGRIDQALSRKVEARGTIVRAFLTDDAAGVRDGTVAWRAAIDDATRDIAEQQRAAESYRADAITNARAEQWTRMVAQLGDAEAALSRTRGDVEAQLAAVRGGDRAAVLAAETGIVRDHAATVARLAQARETLNIAIQRGSEATRDVYDTSRRSILIGLLLAVVISVVVAVTIRRSVVGPLSEFMGFVGRIGGGDLSTTTAATGKDELGRLGMTLNDMVGGLRTIATQNRAATENLNAAATEIRASTQEQAASVEEQLAAVQETAATVDEITHSGAQISRRAQEVIAAAQATAQVSDSGLTAVADTARAMDAIRDQAEAVATNIVALSEKTQAIGDIIATVNDVSERSHLLALNASIEAAAAGEQGRSFAIVAAEMKMLADQAKGATRNVRSILGDIQRGINSSVMLTEEAVKRIASGKERTDQGHAAIEELAARVQENVQTFQQIVASTNQQQIGIEQVTIALQNIRQASQQTAASTRQLDQAAGDLSDLSRTLVSLTERYRL